MCGCDFPQRESVKHVVVDSPSAQRIWKHFQHIFGICSSSLLQQLKLSEWWISKAKSTDFKEILSFVPVCICWEPWKRRNKAKCDGVELRVTFLLLMLQVSLKIGSLIQFFCLSVFEVKF